MIFDLIKAFSTGDAEALKWAVASLLLSLPIIILALSIHETAHGFVAYKLGDPTARNLGRLSLNPIKHLDPIGFLCMVAFRFGWAKPVPINTRYFKKPKRDMMLSAIAGPLSNILLAFVFGGLLKLFFVVLGLGVIPIQNQLTYNLIYFGEILLILGVQLNVMFAIFNLLPIPPLDGSKILYMFLPSKVLYKFLEYERYISLVLLILLASGVLSKPLSIISNLLINLIYFIFQII